MDTHLNTKRILIFLAFAFGIPWTAALVISQTSMMENNPAKALSLANYILISSPLLANIATRLVTREGWGHLWLRPNFRRGWRFYLAAWLLPLLAVIVGGSIYYLIFPQSFDSNLGAAREFVAGSPLATMANPWMILLIMALQFMLIGLLINGVLTITEEFGWRAYLLQKLMDHFCSANHAGSRADGVDATAARKAALLVGVIWGVWHWPLMFMSAKIDPGFTPLIPLVYILSTCSLSVLLSWVTLRSGSVWPASVGHGTINPASNLPGFLLKGTADPLIGPSPIGLIGGIGYTILALVLLFNRRAFAVEKEVDSQKVPAVVVANHSK